MASSTDPSEGTPYAETLVVPVSWWLLGGLLVVAVGWAFFVATPLLVTAVVTLLALTLVAVGLRTYGAARVAVDAEGFRAGRALLPYRYVGAVEPLDPDATRRILGVEADARAYLLVRAYCGGSVRVAVDDPADPAPYWLVSTRNPTALATSLVARSVRD